jgi:hypothetical protein
MEIAVWGIRQMGGFLGFLSKESVFGEEFVNVAG